MPATLVEGRLKAVVLGRSLVTNLDHVPQVWECRGKWAERVATARAEACGPHGRCVQVMEDDQVSPALARVGNRDYVVAEQLVLNAEIEVVIPRRLEVANHGEGIKWGLPSGIGTVKRPGDGRIETDVVANIRNRVVTTLAEGVICKGRALKRPATAADVREVRNLEEAQVRFGKNTRSRARERIGSCQRSEVGNVKGKRVPATHGGFAFAENIPSEAQMRAKIVVIHVMDAADALSHLD